MRKYLYIISFLFIVIWCLTYLRLFFSPKEKATEESSHANHCEGVCSHDNTDPDIDDSKRSDREWKSYGVTEMDFQPFPKMDVEEKKR